MKVSNKLAYRVMTKKGPLGDRTSCDESITFIQNTFIDGVDMKQLKQIALLEDSPIEDSWKKDILSYLSSIDVLKACAEETNTSVIKTTKHKVNNEVLNSLDKAKDYRLDYSKQKANEFVDRFVITAYEDVSLEMGDFEKIIQFNTIDELSEQTDFDLVDENGDHHKFGNKKDLNKFLSNVKRKISRQINKQTPIKQLITDPENIFEVWVDLEE